MGFDANINWEEAFKYRPGTKVELKSQPGSFDIVPATEAMMVAIWLVNDPEAPICPHELKRIQL